jgi:hypothetical protein
MSEPLTHFELSEIMQRGWNTDEQRLLNEIHRLRTQFVLVRDLLSAELPTHWPAAIEVYKIAFEEAKRA